MASFRRVQVEALCWSSGQNALIAGSHTGCLHVIDLFHDALVSSRPAAASFSTSPRAYGKARDVSSGVASIFLSEEMKTECSSTPAAVTSLAVSDSDTLVVGYSRT